MSMNGDSLLNPAICTPNLDGVTPIFVMVGADPSVAPGFQAPQGSVANFNGAYYLKNTTAATGWVAFPLTFSGSTNVVAAWSLTAVRYFILDYDNGNDANTGYIDAAAGSTFTALQTAAVAIKTVEQLYSIVPQIGAGRSFVILQKLRAAGASYLDKDAATVSNVDTSRWAGYRTFLWRGSTDLSNDAADRTTCGFFNAVAGPGASSEFTVAGGATTTVVPIAAGAIAAEAATQFRIRFLPTTTTAALRNICRPIVSNVVNTSVTTASALPAVPAAGDVFVIERPGVRMGSCNFDTRNLGVFSAGGANPQLVGVAFVTTTTNGVVVTGHRPNLCAIELTGVTNNAVFLANYTASLSVAEFYILETGATFPSPGMGLRSISGSTWAASGGLMSTACLGFMNRTTLHSVSMPLLGGFGSRSYLGGQWSFRGAGQSGSSFDPPGGTASGQAQVGDSATGNAQTRITGHTSSTTPFTIFQNPINLWRLNFEGFGLATHGCIYIKDCFGGQMSIDGCTGDGTGPFGLDITQSYGVQVLVGTQIANTVAGTSGQVRLAGPALHVWTDFTKTNIRDNQGNHFTGTAGAVADSFMYALASPADGIALGSPVVFDVLGASPNYVIMAAQTSAVNASVVGIACGAVAANPASPQGVYVARGGTPYVLNTGKTLSVGDVAWLGVSGAGVSLGQSGAVDTDTWGMLLGRWVSGTSGVSGYVALQLGQFPEYTAYVGPVADGGFADTAEFTLPGQTSTVIYADQSDTLLTGIGWAPQVGPPDAYVILLRTATGPRTYKMRFFNNVGDGQARTMRLKAALR